MPDGTTPRWHPALAGLGLVVVMVMLACGGGVEATEPPAPDAPAPADPAPAPTGTPDAPDAVARGAIPPGPVDGAWIGLAARAGGGSEPTTPAVDASLVIWHDIEAWKTIAPGAAAEVASLDGRVPVRFREVAEIPLGCDGNTTRVALFDGPRLPEGPVWVAPRVGQVRMDPAVETARAEDRAEWQVGQVMVTAEGEGDGGRTVVRRGGEEVWAKAWTGPLSPAGWVPEGLVRGRGQILLLSWGSMEGVHYQAVRLGPGDPAELGPDVYLYWCAN